MTLLPVLMLAAGLNTAAYPVSPATHARQAEVTLTRLVTATEPSLRRRTLDQALSTSTAAFNRSASRAPRLASPARQAEITMNRMVENARTRLAARAVDEALTTSLHDYSQAIADEVAHARTAIALRVAAKMVIASLR